MSFSKYKEREAAIVYRYLVRNNLLYSYIHNVVAQNSNHKTQEDFQNLSLKEFLFKYKIMWAFGWTVSKEGYRFWQLHNYKLHSEICDLYNYGKD